MFKKRIITASLGAFLFLSAAHAVNLSPASLPSGQLPSHQASIVFDLANGNWLKEVRLPLSAPDGASVRIRSQAAYDTTLLPMNSELPAPLVLSQGSDVTLFYSAPRQRWMLRATPGFTPNQLGGRLPKLDQALTVYELSDGNWTGEVVLPPEARPGATLFIRSEAAWGVRVSADNALYAGTFNLTRGESMAFRFKEDLKKWYPIATPETVLPAQTLSQGQVPIPSRPMTRVTLWDGNWQPQITLPPSAGDRDRVEIESSATWRSTISPANVSFKGTMTIGNGERYHFMFDASQRVWVPLQTPKRVWQAGALPGGMMPAVQTPVSWVMVGDGNYSRQIQLPSSARVGDRVVIRSDAAWPFSVTASGVLHNIEKGEEVAFVRQAAGWARETITVTLLQLYSRGVVEQFGLAKALERQAESFRLTNEALENSGATFRFRLVGVREFTGAGPKLNDSLGALARDQQVLALRDQYKADLVYYEGTEEGCGFAFLGASGNNVFAVGSTMCGTTVMRHELGHLLNLPDVYKLVTTAAPYMAGTAMEGNALPFFATPHRFDMVTGLPFGVSGIYDSVRTMNEYAKRVAAMR